ncbi:hypothetical protein [Xanthomarina spongicola]|uniref:Uncharacterized protein n=1 Tax=Xanthomarina spongicola TaxID=570520 RepID=A0A316DJZ8_9FLAO|nr:hypothetical protein [Xanthomarina spongicola]PWK18557.1 hypothetical protein LX78_01864 [Xanthomarina spongicola]
MVNEELFEIINAPFSELNKLKIGLLVRATLPEILESELISEIEIKKLTEENYSKMIFDMNYPVLKLVDENLPTINNRTIGDYTRYYANPYKSYNSRYLISSEWYDRNQEGYIKWLKRKVNRN